MSGFANTLKSAFLSKSEDLSAIWTVLNEEERKKAFAKLKEMMQQNTLLLYTICDASLQARFATNAAEEKIFLQDSVFLNRKLTNLSSTSRSAPIVPNPKANNHISL